VNVFDISQSCEDDALQTSTSLESEISKLLWFSKKGKINSLALSSIDNQFSLWCIDDPGKNLLYHYIRPTTFNFEQIITLYRNPISQDTGRRIACSSAKSL